MHKNLLWGVALISLVMVGCAKEQIYHSSPPLQSVSTSDFEVTLEPLKAAGYNYYDRFRCQFINKTGGDLIVDWEKTSYLYNGKNYGRFGWVGSTFDQLREVKEQPQITVPAGKTDSVEIFPLRLIGWKEEGVAKKAATPEAGFTNTPLPAGENGMNIAVLKDGKLVRQKIIVKITKE